MLVLLLFALIAGAGTAVTPCVLPVLPAILSAGAAGGRRRPLGIVVGLAVTFTLAIVAGAKLINGVGLHGGATRSFAVIVLIAFGAVMLVPEISARIEAPLSRLGRFGPKSRGTGFASGLGVGAALGFVCVPCAGPILAAVISASAASARVVFVGLAYAVGLSAVLLLYTLGSRALVARFRRRLGGSRIVERTLGVVLLATGLLMAFNVDVRFEKDLATSDLGALIDPAQALERSHAVQQRLATLRPASRFATAQAHSRADLPDLGPAPDFIGTQRWFNTPGSQPLSLTGLHGRVVLVDFWTYTCINCIRTLPFVEGLYRTYAKSGLTVVGVETPEFAFEHEAGNVQQAITTDGLTYPIAQDNNYATWNAYQNQYWPAEYLIDASGHVRHTQFGEGNYAQDESDVRALLTEAGARNLPPRSTARAKVPSAQLATPETYLNPQRAQGFTSRIVPGYHRYVAPPVGSLQTNQFALGGEWRATDESITPVGGGAGTIELSYQASSVYLVLTSPGNRPQTVTASLDGAPPRSITVRGQQLYTMASLPRAGTHRLVITVPPGVSAYDFTFG